MTEAEAFLKHRPYLPEIRHRQIAIALHGEQTYGARPYVYHLDSVRDCLGSFGFVGEAWDIRAYYHDVPEDTMLHLEPLERMKLLYSWAGPDVLPVWACCGFGKNRKEKQADIRRKLPDDPVAQILKAADRLTNMRETLLDDSGHASMYTREFEPLMEVLRPGIPPEMEEALVGAFEGLLHRLSRES